ncbi:AtpZ/AtpI family protein [Mucilaginibacter achroorhodeus]|uniref:AtpZ/AtpI family protein n=1 Tax=Mucilaginibacter achroorhodeus TaxID=2599294 RepID=A0A563TYK6_9SPHI|nr:MULTISPECIES: AtpZ/AtpI family protein [Mucilaginibacter]QXV65449.1 AtpZ/AtpI family protein [Mucilaginibacter sp. 21P]TWR24445.1 AtpZ/AtpI family protein [Mucilaginibacter achroorhodeus]
MEENEIKDNSRGGGQVNAYAKYTGLAVQMIVVIGVFTFVGYKIDESAAHQTKWVTATLALAGVFVSLYLVIRAVRN